MGEQRLHHALAPIDILTRLELEQVVNAKFDAFTRDFHRGETFGEVNTNANGATSIVVAGPESGYTWSVKLVSVVCSAACTINVYTSDNIQTAPVAQLILTGAGAATPQFGSNCVTIKDQRPLTITVSAGGIGAVKITYKQVPTEMEGKL